MSGRLTQTSAERRTRRLAWTNLSVPVGTHARYLPRCDCLISWIRLKVVAACPQDPVTRGAVSTLPEQSDQFQHALQHPAAGACARAGARGFCTRYFCFMRTARQCHLLTEYRDEFIHTVCHARAFPPA